MARSPENAPKALPFPDHAYIEDFVSEREEVLGGPELSPNSSDIPTTYDGLVRAVRARRRLSVKPSMPANYRTTAQDIRAGQALLADAISRIAATLAAGERSVSVVPAGEMTHDEAERQAKLKRWITAVVLGESGRPSRLQQEAGEPWLELGIDQAVGDGRAIWELSTRPDRWGHEYGHPKRDEYDEDDDSGYARDKETFFRQGAQFPFTINRVDPLSYYERRYDGKAIEAIKVEYRQRREVYPKYGLRRAEDEGDDGDLIVGDPYPAWELVPTSGRRTARCVTYWATNHVPNRDGECDVIWIYEIDGKRVDSGRTVGPAFHPLPFFLFHGQHTSLPDQHMKGVSIAFLLLRLCDAIDRLESMRFNVAMLLSMPAWKRTRPSNANYDVSTGAVGAAASVGGNQASATMGTRGVFKIEPGVGYDLEPGEDIEPIVVPHQVAGLLDGLKNDLMEFTSLVGVPAVMRGVSPGAGSAGYMVSQLVASARTALASVMQNCADAISMLVSYLLWQVEAKFEEGVSVWYRGDKRGKNSSWLALKPKEIGGNYAVTIDVAPNLPIDQIQQNEASLRQVESGSISMQRHRETMGIESPGDEQEMIEAEQALKHTLIALPRQVRIAIRLGYLTPDQGAAVLAKEFGISPPQAAAQINQGVILGPNGQPLAPGAGGGPPGVPALPNVAPIPPSPDLQQTNAALYSLPGSAGIPQPPPIPPNLAAQAVGAA